MPCLLAQRRRLGVVKADAERGATRQAVTATCALVFVWLGLCDTPDARFELDRPVGAMLLADTAFNLANGQTVLINSNDGCPGGPLRGRLTDGTRFTSFETFATFIAATALKCRFRETT